MARLAMRVKEEKRKRLMKRYDERRKQLRAAAINMKLSEEEREQARVSLNKLPKNSASERQRNRCMLTGRPRGYLGKFGLGRLKFRQLASLGLIPGVTKASW